MSGKTNSFAEFAIFKANMQFAGYGISYSRGVVAFSPAFACLYLYDYDSHHKPEYRSDNYSGIGMLYNNLCIREVWPIRR